MKVESLTLNCTGTTTKTTLPWKERKLYFESGAVIAPLGGPLTKKAVVSTLRQSQRPQVTSSRLSSGCCVFKLYYTHFNLVHQWNLSGEAKKEQTHQIQERTQPSFGTGNYYQDQREWREMNNYSSTRQESVPSLSQTSSRNAFRFGRKGCVAFKRYRF